MASESSESLPIPQPPPHLFVGNFAEIDPNDAPGSFQRLADIYGEIYQLELPGRDGKLIVVSSYDTINDCCDSERFEKPINATLEEVRALTGDGLFTAYPGEKAWGVAHRLLMPVFGPMGIRKMFDGMMDISTQMLLRWDRFGPEHEIECSDDFTRLTFDMIGLCAFGYRFNNFYTDRAHPFVEEMVEVLIESGRRATRTSVENKLRVFAEAHRQENVKKMHELCDQIIADRIAHPQPDAKDLLNPMLEGVDKETGEKMTKESVRYNMVTFLVAGHETTSGTLGFLFYHLLRNPEKYLKAQQEVDEVLGDGPLELKHIPKLTYIKFAIYEALRFLGPIAINGKHSLKPTKIAGKYQVQPKDQILMNLKGLHHDPKVYGDDADVFRPERFLNGGWENLPPNAWKAFGDGIRACIGRTFAEQEMIMVVALILQKFQVELADPGYQLHVAVTITQKPKDLKIKVRRRPGRTMASLGGAGTSTTAAKKDDGDGFGKTGEPNAPTKDAKPITVLYGSNAGTCKSYAEDLETNAGRYGFKANIGSLDSATEHVPKDQPIVIIEPSYEGKPADNAKKFTAWLESNANSKLLEGVQYAVFGVGNSDWTHSYHRVPKLTDELFEKMGAKHFTETGFVNVKEDIMGPWEKWSEQMWSDLRKSSGTTTEILGGQLQADITPPKFATYLGGKEIGYGEVKVNKDLGGGEVGLTKKHMEIELPLGTSYRSGDYMVILPLNSISNVRRVMKRFDLSPDDNIHITGTNKTFIMTEAPISIFDLLMTRVELGTPISQKQLQTLAEATPENKRARLLDLANDETYKKEVIPKRYSILDILEDHPDCQLPFAVYLDSLKPLSPRQYSISSSPLANVEFVQTAEGNASQRLTASLTYDVHDEAAWSGDDRRFHGVASTYLARQEPGEKIRCFPRPTNINFHLPSDPTVPVIMICAGSGLAPMRGFIQERATIKKARNAKVGPAILYFGCRHYEKDFIYSDELKQWETDGVVSVRGCFSKVAPSGEKAQRVPDRMWDERKELAELFGDGGAKIFICGSASKLAKSTAEVCMKIFRDTFPGKTEQDALEWLEKIKEDRYVSDVFE
ncbi:Bifunctional cytochrome P450/NADPH--P450 reductase [Alternaria arborescens]|uniref:Bifunctional cytochrome P450/NADPH--P450 reductase n=1 Tax=Alternaria arborescens TaxID=156630 RepID=A0A4Q4Q0G9_9PLEO|nr:Bifunctional cytochrome P450/NADPH--P450 reductase [Alternaria arborescens]